MKFYPQRTDCNESWSTPDALFDELDDEFGFTLDVCADDSNAKCGRYFTVENDGLFMDWGDDICWMNPPYGRTKISAWMEKAYREVGSGSTVVCLLPSRTDTAWFHDYALKGEIRFIRGRLKFGSGTGTAPFPSMLVIFRPSEWGVCDDLLRQL